jgi:hypothetical protein
VAEQSAKRNSAKSLEIKTNKEYNGDDSYSLKNADNSEQYGVMWTLGTGVLDNREVSAFYEKISETRSNKYHNYRKASDGQIIYEVGNKLIYTDGDYDYPHISKVVTINANNNYCLEYGMECFYEGEQYGYETDTIIETVEAVLGKGSVETATYSSYEADKGSRKSRDERTDSRETNRGSQNDVGNNNRHSYSLKSSFSTDGMAESDVEIAQNVIKSLKMRAIGSKYVDGYASYTVDRIEREIRASSSSDAVDYAKSYVAWVSPIDFVYATTTSEQTRQALKEEAGPLNIEKLKGETQPIHLTVDFETGEIVGHEGRHRMLALQQEGIDNVAIIIDALNDNRHHTKPIEFMSLTGQQFQEHRKGLDMFLHNMLPLSQRYADIAREVFTNTPKNGIQYSLKDNESNSISSKDRKELLDIVEHLKSEFELTKFAKADPLSQQQIEEMVARARFASEEYEERPKFNPFIFILLCFFGIFPMAIYWIVLRARQKQWDKDHKRK